MFFLSNFILMEKSRKKFLKMPRLDGGKEKLRQFIKDNLRYPQEAIENKVEGDVVVKYKVSGLGEVFDASVVHGIGHGCDEEALRLVSLLQYEAVKNRGVRVTSNSRMKIPFRLPRQPKQAKMNMVYTPKSKAAKPATEKKPEEKKPETYSYTIKF
jgi:TonB family protein